MYKVVHIAIPITGVGVYVNLLVGNIDSKSFKSILISNNNDKNIPIKDKSNKEIDKFYVNLRREINIINDFKCLIQIISALKKIKPNLIHCHSAKAGILGRIAGLYLNIPTLYTPHAFSYLSTNNKIKRYLYKSIEKCFKFTSSKLLCCSASESDRAINDLKIKSLKVLQWNNSIPDIVISAKNPVIKKLPEKYLCTIGRPSYQKNFEMMIDVIKIVKKEISKIHLVLLGVGHHAPETAHIKKLIKLKKLENNITLIPWVNRNQSLNILKESMFYISTALYEGLPFSVIEALALAKPCVVSNVDGNKDLIIEKHNGFLIDNFDKLEMAKKIIDLYQNKELLLRLSNNSRKEFLKKHHIKNAINQLESIYLNELKKY